LQHGNYLPWPTWFPSQVGYPINAQIQVLWSILFWRTDTFAGFTDWIASIISILAVYGIARILHFERPKAIFASFIFALFPEILLQSSTTMPHILASTLIICAFYFLFLGFFDRSKIMLVLSGLAIGMAVGVHFLVFFTLPGYIFSALYFFIKDKKYFPKSIIYIFTSSFLSFALLSSYMYIQNTIIFNNPLGGSATDGNTWVLQGSNLNNYWKPKNALKYTFFNLSRYIFASYDTTGISSEIVEPFYKIRDAIFIPIFEKTQIPMKSGEFDINVRPNFVSENYAWFGMVGFILFFPLVIIGFIYSIKKKEPIQGILIFNIILYALIWSAIIARENNWTMYSGRYFVPSALLFSPLIAMVYKNNFWNKLLCSFLVVASIYICYGTMLNNYTKPLISQGAIFKWTRLEKIYNMGWDQYPVGVAIDKYIPKKATLGTALDTSIVEYPFFGEYFQRKIIHIFPFNKMNDTQWLQSQDINWILDCVDNNIPENFIEVEIINLKMNRTSECKIFKRE